MKKTMSVLLTLVFVFMLSACNNDKSSAKTGFITRDRAIEIALDIANLSRNDVRDLEAELDREINASFWEVDFEHGEYDYSYNINATTGEVIRNEKERY